MTGGLTTTSLALGGLDRQILHGLVIDGRAPFARIGAALGVSEQTVARRYRRLHDDGVVRVVASRNPLAAGSQDWFVRLRARPDAVESLAAALAARPDTSWVVIASGGAEVICSVRPPHDDLGGEDTALLLDRLPRAGGILAMQAQLLLRKFEGDAGEWTAFSPGLPDGAHAALVRDRGRPVPGPTPLPDAVRADDLPLLVELGADGRASYRALAAASGWSESRVARRVGELFAAGVVEVDVDLAVARLGFTTHAYLWITAPPRRVEEIGRAVVALPQVAFVAATTGSTALLAAVVCRSPGELYRLVTADVGSLEGVTAVETTPSARRVKQAGSLLRGERLSVPGRG